MSEQQPTDHTLLRLIMPQWQGGNNPPYFLGSKLLNWLAPNAEGIEEEVPVSLQEEGLKVEQGIFARTDVLKQFHAAQDILHKNQPTQVVVFGGDCSVELAPIAYLNEKYDGDMAILWIDSHPDVNVPGHNEGHNSQVLANLLGVGDEEFVAGVPKKVERHQVLYVGLNEWQPKEQEIMDTFDLKAISPEQILDDSSAVLDWLNDHKPSRVFIHFDLDVLDLREIRAILPANPFYYEKMKTQLPRASSLETIIRVIQDVANQYEVVGLGITEHVPWDAYFLQNMLERLPLIGDARKKDQPHYNWIWS
ncbi:arginase family protein [Paenibacillus sp. WLX1005]|uniref:arginase family protein n=1 Tax=Paenibacillus sp. WLX1005 TaxID=3243766 RepID=UPI003983EE41